MKKLSLLCVLTSFLLVSCKASMTYESLISKMKTYSGEIVMDNNYSSGFYSEEGFFLNNGQVTLYCNGSSSSSEGYVFITLPNSTSAPDAYRCLYGWESSSTSYKEVASFYIQNTYTSSTRVVFDAYTGDMKSTSQDLAKSCVDLILTVIKYWVYDELNSDFSSTGMFPNY